MTSIVLFIIALALVGGIVFAVSGTLHKAHPEPPGEEDFGNDEIRMKKS